MSEYYEVEVESHADLHVHLREKEEKIMRPLIENLIAGGADVLGPMPNTEEGLTTAMQVIEYKQFAQKCIPADAVVKMMPILLLNEQTTIKMIDECVAAGIVDCKILPLNKTTQSQNGVKNYGKILPVIKHCGKVGMKTHLHPEHPSAHFDDRNAEFAFLPILYMLLEETQGVIISEHGTDARCIPIGKRWLEADDFL